MKPNSLALYFIQSEMRNKKERKMLLNLYSVVTLIRRGISSYVVPNNDIDLTMLVETMSSLPLKPNLTFGNTS